MRAGAVLVGLLGTVLPVAQAVDLDPTNSDSVRAAGVLLSKGLMDYYTGNQSGQAPGMFSNPYYWWEAGVAWGTMLDYGHFTGNLTYDSLVHSSLLYQSGEYWNYMTYNQTSTEGNDDQAFWGLTVMAAAEQNYTAPGKGYPNSWLYFAQATFNTMADRWDTQHCHGGLRWQIYTWNAGYDYKNLVSNGCLFHLAARLYRYTGNSTFLHWAEKTWNWMDGVNFVNNSDPKQPDNIYAYDGASIEGNCSTIAPYEWTYNYGLLISGCAYLYDETGTTIWNDRVNGLWARAKVLFQNETMYEAACQPRFVNGNWTANRCNNDQRCFKGIFARLLRLAMVLNPNSDTTQSIWEYMIGSANSMALSCSGGTDGHTCGLNWLVEKWDGLYGLGEQICAVDLLNTLLYKSKPGPLRAKDVLGDSGPGVEKNHTYGYPDAGLNSSTVTAQLLNLTGKDKAGAGVLTAFVLLILICASVWLLF